MPYTPKTKEWFIERIGKKIYRDDQGCPCHLCWEGTIMGFKVSDNVHAQYLAEVDAEYGFEGIYSNYRDVK